MDFDSEDAYYELINGHGWVFIIQRLRPTIPTAFPFF